MKKTNAPKTTEQGVKLDIAAAKRITTAETTFKTFVIAAGATWPLAQSSPEYKPLVEAYSVAKKTVRQDGAKNINTPAPAASLKPSKQTKTKADKTAKTPKTKATKEEGPSLSDSEIEAIEAIVRSKTVRPCGCGCGVETRASFLPGHDAKLRSRLLNEAKARKIQTKAA